MPDSLASPNLAHRLPLAETLITDIDASPTPYHAAKRAAEILIEAGATAVDIGEPLPATPGAYFVIRGGAMVAWVLPDSEPHGYCVVGAHTDSPNLRVRTNAEITSAGWAQVGMEVYGGVLLNSWLDRDLGLAGRVTVRTDDGPQAVLVSDDAPMLRVPQLAIHLDREIREKGLLLNPQKHLTPLWATATEPWATAAEESSSGQSAGFADYVASMVATDGPSVAADDILSWELMAFDVQTPSLVGRDADLLSSARIDNQLSCFAAAHALAAHIADAASANRVPVLVLYDHEEVGSTSATGAAGGFLSSLLERISAAAGTDRVGHLEAMARSIVVSADGAHATHPNYPDRHEPDHHIAMNGGIVVKRNANQRYASDAENEGWFRSICRQADVPVQTYIHRNDLPCGSTIGPLASAELAVSTVDIGAPQLAMHSIRELAGAIDIDHLANALYAAWIS